MHIREESRKKVDHPYYVFGDLMEIPKYGDFLIKKSSKSGDFGNFFFFFPPTKILCMNCTGFIYFGFLGSPICDNLKPKKKMLPPTYKPKDGIISAHNHSHCFLVLPTNLDP
jgi:hypothetical protein